MPILAYGPAAPLSWSITAFRRVSALGRIMPFTPSSQIPNRACEVMPSIWHRSIWLAKSASRPVRSANRLLQLTALLTICTVVLFARKPDAFLRPQFLGEDGTLYFAEAHRLGMPALWRPYRGTYWLFQRLVAHLG